MTRIQKKSMETVMINENSALGQLGKDTHTKRMWRAKGKGCRKIQHGGEIF